jgi:hypothetical protein
LVDDRRGEERGREEGGGEQAIARDERVRSPSTDSPEQIRARARKS